MHDGQLPFTPQTTALNTNGNHLFVTRYITPQNPPQQLLPTDNAGSVLHTMVCALVGCVVCLLVGKHIARIHAYACLSLSTYRSF